MELAAEWSEQWGDNSVPAPFEGLEDILRAQMEEKENAPQEGAMEEGAINGEQGYSGEQTGNDADRAGGEGLNDDGRAISVGMDAGNAAGQGSDRFQNLVREEVTPAALGVDNGSTTANVKVLDESRFEEGSIEAQTIQRAREMGLEPVAISGTMQIGEGENAKQARAYIKGNRVILQADGPVSMDKLLRHEEYHREARRNANLNGIIRQSLANNLSEQELNDLVAQYIMAYDGIYDFSKLSQKQIEAICEEELFADLYAGIDNTGKTELRDTATGAYADAQTMQQQNAEAERESTGPPEGRAQTFVGYDADTGKGIYESNFPENTPAAEKSKRVVELVQKVWSKKPIDLVIQNEDGTTQVIQAQFDPDFDETENRKTDLGKLAYGNRQGNRREKRVTLNLADDYYQILQDAKYITSEGERGKEGPTHKDVEVWHYFVNQIFYRAQGEEETTPYSIYIDVKQKPTGDFVYTFYAREDTGGKNNEQTTPQTNSAAVNSSENGTANGLLTDSIPDANGKSNTQNEGRASAEVDSRRSLERELQELKDAYQAASDRNDTEFDYRGTLQKITELEKELGEKDTSSVGQRQKAYLAMALAQDTDVILMDEPTTFLDIRNQLDMLECIRRLREEGKTILMILHDFDLTLRYADHCLLMGEGRILREGGPKDVLLSPELQSVFSVKPCLVETENGPHCYVV